MSRAVLFRVTSSKAVKRKSSFSGCSQGPVRRLPGGGKFSTLSRLCLDRSSRPPTLPPGSVLDHIHLSFLPSPPPLAETPTEGSSGQDGLLSLQVQAGWLCVPGTEPIFPAPRVSELWEDGFWIRRSSAYLPWCVCSAGEDLSVPDALPAQCNWDSDLFP